MIILLILALALSSCSHHHHAEQVNWKSFFANYAEREAQACFNKGQPGSMMSDSCKAGFQAGVGIAIDYATCYQFRRELCTDVFVQRYEK